MDTLLHRHPPTLLERLQSSRLLFFARLLYSPPPVPLSQSTPHVRIVCISDTHNHQPLLPNGDILIHAGDLTVSGTQHEIDNALSWLESQPHPHKFFIAGNHDRFLVDADIHQYISSRFPSLTYLQESSAHITIHDRTLHIYGSPFTPQHGHWEFQYPRVHPPWYSPSEKPTSDYKSTQIWSRIPPLTDILITHGPPLGHLDNNISFNLEKSAAGCYALLTALWRVRPKLHVFGHIHIARGVQLARWDGSQKAYEEVLAKRVRWTGLLSLVWYTVRAWLWRGTRGEDGTVMVNAASLGGFRDEKINGAIVVDI